MIIFYLIFKISFNKFDAILKISFRYLPNESLTYLNSFNSLKQFGREGYELGNRF